MEPLFNIIRHKSMATWNFHPHPPWEKCKFSGLFIFSKITFNANQTKNNILL
uniref:Uncharacterized protein n=1 Tax=Nelumbo nucifera TaxID=4432 RepID=A0A822XZ64_NELNU|nr:TPA_asm: hypothetical protein HUJ06_028392 [Nelumbo nucifera]